MSIVIHRPPTSPLFPYTTLFRSQRRSVAARLPARHRAQEPREGHLFRRAPHHVGRHRASARSEEHTSELQSHVNLVCRLLLEKKKKNVLALTLVVSSCCEALKAS